MKMFIEYYQCQGVGARAVTLPEARCRSKEQRRRKLWGEPSHSVLEKLEKASIISSDSLTAHGSMTDTGASCIKNKSKLQELLDSQNEIIPYLRCAGGACGEPSEKEMGPGSSGGAAETVGGGRGEQSLQHVYNKERRLVHI